MLSLLSLSCCAELNATFCVLAWCGGESLHGVLYFFLSPVALSASFNACDCLVVAVLCRFFIILWTLNQSILREIILKSETLFSHFPSGMLALLSRV